MICKDDSYTKLYDLIEGCVKATAYDQIGQCKKMLVVAINIETRFKRFVSDLTKENPTVALTIVAQPAMAEVLQKEYAGKYSVISWQGRYTLGVLDAVKENGFALEDFDGFLFFSEQAVNLRDSNFMSMAEVLQAKNRVRVFCNTIGDEVYEYQRVAVYNQAMKVYQEINDLIDLCLSSEC